MAKNLRNVRDRLHRAALVLFRERGYDQTTAAEIAATAGVTERTFFRQFPDKREVLFDGEAVLRTALTEAIGEAPDELGPIATLSHAFHSVVPLLEGNRSYAKPRQDLIASTPALAERELAKLAVLADAMAEALQRRGLSRPGAVLAARTGMAVFAQATIDWLDEPVPGLLERLDTSFSTLKEFLTAFELESARSP